MELLCVPGHTRLNGLFLFYCVGEIIIQLALSAGETPFWCQSGSNSLAPNWNNDINYAHVERTLQQLCALLSLILILCFWLYYYSTLVWIGDYERHQRVQTSIGRTSMVIETVNSTLTHTHQIQLHTHTHKHTKENHI